MAHGSVVVVTSQTGGGSKHSNEDSRRKWMVRGWEFVFLLSFSYCFLFSFLSSFFLFFLCFPLFFLSIFSRLFRSFFLSSHQFCRPPLCFLLCFFLSFCHLFFYRPPPSERVFIGGRERENYPTPVQSCRRGRVAWAATVQPPQGCPQCLSPLFFFVSMVGHEKSVGCVGVFGQVRERERDAAKKGKKTSFPCLQHVQRKKMTSNAIKTTLFCSVGLSFFSSYNSEQNRVILYKMRCFI